MRHKKGNGALPNNNKHYKYAICWAIIFAVFTFLVGLIDVQPIGPEGSYVGFAGINGAVFTLCGVHEFFLDLTDIFGIAVFATCGIYGFTGIKQWIERKKLFDVDHKIILLGIFYFIMLGLFAVLNVCVVNFAPTLQDGELHASYPSSHVLMTIFVLKSALLQDIGTKDSRTRKLLTVIAYVLIAVMIAGRLLAGEHWFTDIFGSILVGEFLLQFYMGACEQWPDNIKN